jgi:hypothetical protein
MVDGAVVSVFNRRDNRLMQRATLPSLPEGIPPQAHGLLRCKAAVVMPTAAARYVIWLDRRVG